MTNDMQTFIRTKERDLHALAVAIYTAYWNLSVTGEDRYAEENRQLREAWMAHFSNAADYAQVRAWYTTPDPARDPAIQRCLYILYRHYVANQHDPATIGQIAELEAQLDTLFTTTRAQIGGQEYSENDLATLLRTSQDGEECREAWEASKQIGVPTAPKIMELVAVRNAYARKMGWTDYYAMALELDEVNESNLFHLMQELEEQTRQPFLQMKAQLDQILGDRFRTDPAQLRPWHYGDPFFQEAPQLRPRSLDHLFADKDIIGLSLQTFDAMGFDLREIITQSDLFERPGKHQFAFCAHIDPATNDIRVLANLRADAISMETALHEFGHAIYNRGFDPDLPYLLRIPAHMSTTEGIAMLMDNLTRSPTWLAQYVAPSTPETATLLRQAAEEERARQLVFMRWALVVVHFERDLYRSNYSLDELNTRWWEYVARFQGLSAPDERHAPDWASKVHLAVSPVYYQNYILGRLTAHQVRHRLEQLTQSKTITTPEAGRFLREQLFAYGALSPWYSVIEQFSGEPLNPRYFAEQSSTPPAL